MLPHTTFIVRLDELLPGTLNTSLVLAVAAEQQLCVFWVVFVLS